MVEFLGQPDGVLEYGVGLRVVICAAVRRHQPEIVVTNNFRASWGGQSLNQADHIVVGMATLDAVRDAGNRWVFHDQISDGLQPWGGVRQVWAAGSPNSRHAVDTTATFDRGVASLEAHRAYIDGLGWEHFDPQEFLGAVPVRPAPGSACRWPRRSRCSPWAGVSDRAVTCGWTGRNASITTRRAVAAMLDRLSEGACTVCLGSNAISIQCLGKTWSTHEFEPAQ